MAGAGLERTGLEFLQKIRRRDRNQLVERQDLHNDKINLYEKILKYPQKAHTFTHSKELHTRPNRLSGKDQYSVS